MQVNTILMVGKPILYTAKMVLEKLCVAISTIGKGILGFEASKSGIHSLRSGAAMDVYLNKIPV